jgi:hypothetical protein
MINNHQSITAKSSAKPRNDLLLEIEHTPEEYIPELLQIVRLFRQSVTMKQTSLKNWENAINESDAIKKEHRKTNIKRLFESWNELDDQQEQQETLEVIESMNRISI